MAVSSPAYALPPTVTVPGPQTVNEGVLLAFSVSATDPDGGTVQLRASNLPTGATFVDNLNNTGSFSWTPASDQSGNYMTLFTADDMSGGLDAKGVPIQVNDVNAAPVLNPIGDQAVQQGGEMSIQISGFDPEGAAVSFSETGLPSYGYLDDAGNGTAWLTLMPSASEPAGATSMTVHLSDGQNTTSETFSIRVYEPGNANTPSLSTVANQSLAEGETRSVSVSATDADNNVMSWTSSLPGFASLVSTGSFPGSATARLDLAPGFCAAGTYSASITVSDGSWSDTKSFTVNVTDVNRVPSWSPPSGGYVVSLNEGSSANLSVLAADPDQQCGAAAPMLSLQGAPSSLTVTFTDQGGGSGLLHMSAGFSAAGTYQITLRARDAAGSADVSVQVTVQNVNRAPVASCGGPYSGLVGTAVSMGSTGSSDPDGDALSYAWTFGDGWTGSGQTPSHTYAVGGTYNVCLTVTDAGTPNLTDTKCTTATVQNVNRAPVASCDGPYTGYVGAPVSMSSTGSSDADGDLLTCAWTFGDGGTGTGPALSHAYAASDTFDVCLIVRDNGTPSLGDTLCTTAAIRAITVVDVTFQARVSLKKNEKIKLEGEQLFKIEPVGGSFRPRAVNLGTVVMKYAGREIPAEHSRMTADTDRNGMAEIQASFSGSSLQTLFASLPDGRSTVTVRLEGALVTGGKFRGDASFQIKKGNNVQNGLVSPNPINPEATLSFFMAERGSARVNLYDIKGRLVRSLMDVSDVPAGYHSVRIDGRGADGARLASGVYFYRVDLREGRQTGQFVVMK